MSGNVNIFPPYWRVLDHFILTRTNAFFESRIISDLINWNFLLKDDEEFGTKFDFLAIKKKAKRKRHHNEE
jgi:hypothetical protein